MGEDKLLLEIEGVPAVLRIAAALSVVADDIVVAGRAGIWFGLSGIPDPGPPHRGPLAGIVVALSAAGTGWVAVAGVDQPWLRPGTVLELGRLADSERAVVPIDQDPAGDVCLLSRFVEAELAGALLGSGRPAQALLDDRPWRPVEQLNGAPGARTADRGSRWIRRLRSPRGCHVWRTVPGRPTRS